MSAKIKSCQWMSAGKEGPVECKAMPTKLAKRCGNYYCVAFHYQFGKTFKPFEQPVK
jgi:hypothetical protein